MLSFARMNKIERGHRSHMERLNAQLDHDGYLPRSVIKMASNVVRYKARLVAKGFKQKHDVDFLETYSSVANMNSTG
ncbi:putative reverse transcriptase, RNA-dependent DNA polymerase [Plasmopara halstedii]